MNELLSILKTVVPELPSDSRKLKKTPSFTPSVRMDRGTYVHHGLKDGLTYFLINYEYKNSIILLDFNIDGLPVSKCSLKQVWPILCNIVGTNYVFLIGLYEGMSKPCDADEFLSDFVHELQELVENGFSYHQNHFTVHIRTFICDAPARLFVLKTKGHRGF